MSKINLFTTSFILLFATIFATAQSKPAKIPLKYLTSIKRTTDPFTGVERFNYSRPTLMFVERNGDQVSMLLKIAVRRAVTQPEISKILIRVKGQIFEIQRNERDFKTREISDTKDTNDEKTKVVKQRYAQRVFIDEFVGSIEDYEDLFKALLKNKALIRIEGNVEIADQKMDDTDITAAKKLHKLYMYLKSQE